MRRSRKPLCLDGHRGFESPPLRQNERASQEPSERWPSGLRRTLGKRVYVNSVPWVRIPLSPPPPSRFSSRKSTRRSVSLYDGRNVGWTCPVASASIRSGSVGRKGGKRMPRSVHRLSAKAIEKAKRPGYHCDGGGLYLQVSPTLSKSWIFRYTRDGKTREMGLGSERDVTLAAA